MGETICELCFFALLLLVGGRLWLTQEMVPGGLDIFSNNLQFVLDPIISLVNEPGGLNIYSQYGNYAIFISPVLKFFPDRILAVSIFFAILLMANLVCFYLFILKITSKKIFAIAAAVSILFLAGNFTTLSWVLLPYFQYFPIRVVFPAAIILLFLTCQAKKKENELWRWLIPACCGIALVWNLDTGVCITIAYFFVNFIQLVEEEWNVTQKNKTVFQLSLKVLKKIVPEFLLRIGVCLVVMLIFTDPRNLSYMLKSQANYYIDGFFMLPLPLPLDCWQIVIALYIAGGVYFFKNFLVPKKDKYPILLLSIFGIGIFSYYQGRSDMLVLTSCIYPAVLLFFIFLSKFFVLINARSRPLCECFLFGYTFLMLFFLFIISIKGLRVMQHQYWGKKGISIIKSKANFIKETSVTQKRVAIISDDSTYLYNLTEKQSYPFIRRTLTILKKSELDAMLKAIDKANIDMLYVDVNTSTTNFPYFFKELNKLVAQKYITVSKDDSRKMVLLKLKNRQ